MSFDYKAKRFARGGALPPLERHHAWKEIFSADLRAELRAAPSPAGFDPLDVYRERYAATAGAQPLARLQDVDRSIYLVDDLLVKTDRASMAHSLEARVPFLDTAVTDLALSVPTQPAPARVPEEAPAAARGRAASAATDPPRPEARLLDPGGGVAARRASPRSRATCCRRTRCARQGLFRPEAVERLLEGARIRAGGSQPADLVPDDPRALARALRRPPRVPYPLAG